MPERTIADIPQIPPEIIDAVNNDKLVIFFGAGTSRLIGCKNWEELAHSLVEICFSENKWDNPSATCINYKEREALINIKDSKKIISICQSILEKNKLSNVFSDAVIASLKVNDDLLKKQDIYSELYHLRGLFITTNIDDHFDKNFLESNIVYQKDGFNTNTISDTKLYHIHGLAHKWDSVVLTVKQYLERYNDPTIMDFLIKIFKEKVILFIGYGLSEFEVLDYLITKSESGSSQKSKHFILLPYYLGEETLLEFDEYYYSDLGITVIPYAKDDKGYAQVFDVIKQWNQKIITQSQYLSKIFDELKKYADNYDSSIEKTVFQHIKNDLPFKNEFFKQLSSSQNPVPWLIPLKDKGCFNPKNNPESTDGYGSYWNVMGVLKNIAEINHRNPAKEKTKEILNIIDSIIDYKDGENGRINNIFTDRIIIQIIFLLPLKHITQNRLYFIKRCLQEYEHRDLIAQEIEQSAFPRLLESNNKTRLLKILDITLDFKRSTSKSFEDYQSILGQYYLNTVLENYSEKIISLCGIDAINIALKKIEIIVEEDQNQFNNIWIPSISEYSEYMDRYENQLVHFVWKSHDIIGIEKIHGLSKSLLEMKHPIFKRIAIRLINEYYSALHDVFWNIKENPLEEYCIKSEVYELFTNHSKKFTELEIQKVIEWIEMISYQKIVLFEDKIKQDERVAYRKKEWLSVLLPTGNKDVQANFDKYNAINPAKISPPVPSDRVSSGFESSPISKDSLLKKSNLDIADYLNNLKVQDFENKFVSTNSLGAVLRLSIIDDPKKYVDDLDPFLSVDPTYQSDLLSGLAEAWRKEKHFSWVKVINYINSILESDNFWAEQYQEGKYNYRNQIISNIALILLEGTQKDAHLMPLKLLPQVKKILLKLSNNTDSDFYQMGDLVTSVLNSTKGKIYSSMVIYSLCFARHSRESATIRWPKEIKSEFEKRFDPIVEPTLEFSVTLGKYLQNLYYLDEFWVRENISKIFPQENDEHWNAAFTAYLYYSKISEKIYSMLKMHGDYAKAIQKDFENSQINQRLINHICIGYLNDFELLSDNTSLIKQIIDRWNAKQIVDMIHSLRPQSGQAIPSDKRQKVFDLWEIIILKIDKDTENVDNIIILAELNQWFSVVDELTDKICDWLKKSSKYVKPYDTNFIDNLIRHASIKPKCCSEIFLNIIELGKYFPYSENKIIEFVKLLYNGNEISNADKICNSYLLAGFDFLKSTYEENTENYRVIQ